MLINTTITERFLSCPTNGWHKTIGVHDSNLNCSVSLTSSGKPIIQYTTTERANNICRPLKSPFKLLGYHVKV